MWLVQRSSFDEGNCWYARQMKAVLQTVYIPGMSGRVSRAAADDDEVEVDGGPAASCTGFQVACRLRYVCLAAVCHSRERAW